jgi:hypothetical protein
MNRQELRLKLVRIDKERDMVLRYLKHSQNEDAKKLYEDALEYLNHQTDLTLEQLEQISEVSYEH